MRVKKLQLIKFKRFTDLTIDLGTDPAKIIALVGPNGCGKSSVFDAFEEKAKDYKGGGTPVSYLSKSLYFENADQSYDKNNQIKIEYNNASKQFGKNSFYFRSSYRFTARIDAAQIRKLPNIEDDQNRPQTSIDLDSRLHENYERLIGSFYNEVYNRDKTGKQWADENINILNQILNKVLDITVSNLGNPVEGKGKLYFEKGYSKNFPYENLSSGEKEVIDIIIDLIVKSNTYNDTVFCIDEPELHLNTAIQRKLLIEIEKIIPDTCQLWIATHSIGFLRALQEELNVKTQIIDMGGHNFDEEIKLQPIKKTRHNWQSIFRTALEDITGLVAPKLIIYCEGTIANSLDEEIFNAIFSEIDHCLFVSATNKNESLKYAGVALTVLNKAFDGVKIKVLADRDDDTGTTPKGSSVKICKLERREFENYLYDYEIISKTFPNITVDQWNAIVEDKVNDDIKSKMQQIKTLLGETNDKHLRLKLAQTITIETQIYKDLNKIIFE